MDCENCRHLTVVGLHDTGSRSAGLETDALPLGQRVGRHFEEQRKVDPGAREKLQWQVRRARHRSMAGIFSPVVGLAAISVAILQTSSQQLLATVDSHWYLTSTPVSLRVLGGKAVPVRNLVTVSVCLLRFCCWWWWWFGDFFFLFFVFLLLVYTSDSLFRTLFTVKLLFSSPQAPSC